MTAETLIIVAAAILSLLFSYLPGLRERFYRLDKTGQRLVMVSLLAAIVAGVYALSCTGSGDLIPGLVVTCDRAGAVALVRLFIAAVVSNQGTYALSPRKR